MSLKQPGKPNGKRQRKSKIDVAKLRRKTGLSQTDFWNPVGVTQSGGSRYESGRAVPLPVRLLIGARYLDEPVAAWAPAE